MEKAYLILENGQTFEGLSFGAVRDTVGELVFTTGVVGYLETLTDPSYAGQIVLQTFPQIGNYGVISEDFEGTPALRGYVVREYCDAPSNFRSEGGIDEFLKSRRIPAICGVDTREITRIIRESGVMNAIITTDPAAADTSALASYRVTGELANVSTGTREDFPAVGDEKHHVVLLDYGAKHNIERELYRRHCRVSVVPYNTSADKILEMKPDGVMLSNGPGDPAEYTECAAEIKKLLGKLPLFGICLGHQLLALAAGGKTAKLKYGHRGANQPVKCIESGRTYITSQNHGYAVVSDSLDGIGHVTYINANDGSCEGVSYSGKSAFSVQFHPEACAGPCDTTYLFDDFLDMMGGDTDAAR